jgi:hypothetical protein
LTGPEGEAVCRNDVGGREFFQSQFAHADTVTPGTVKRISISISR